MADRERVIHVNTTSRVIETLGDEDSANFFDAVRGQSFSPVNLGHLLQEYGLTMGEGKEPTTRELEDGRMLWNQEFRILKGDQEIGSIYSYGVK